MSKIKYKAYLDEYQKIAVLISKNYKEGEPISFRLVDKNTAEMFELTIIERIILEDQIKYNLSIHGFVTLGNEYYIIDNFQTKTPLLLGYIARTEEFDKNFYYEKNDLGMRYTSEQTQFKLWSPTATAVSLILYEKENVSFYPMIRKNSGVWELIISHDLEGYFYRYEITNNGVKKEAIDPYGISSSENGKYSAIIDLKKTVPILSELKPKLEQMTDAIIYEVSIRDITIHASSKVKQPGTFLGLTELITDEKGNSNGLAYLKKLGVTHIQLLPIFDFEGIDELDPSALYNWGYNPSQYNVPEGSYATNPKDPYSRINELKHLINILHENGFRVIMDVVYNHVYKRETFPFDAIVPTYFFRYDYQGMPSDGSGCGNDLATERLMARKFVVDSIKFWLENYGIDGFRFDLMGLLDVDTMNKIRHVCDELDPTIMLYGEGWDMNTPLPQNQKASSHNAYQLPRIAHFNDTFRDNIKGHTFDHKDRGLALGEFSKSEIGKQVLGGSSGLGAGESFKFFSPCQSINYVECHDNHTFWDRMKISNDEEGEVICQKRQLLATSMVIFSQGIPFLHCGQEFFRSKQGVENSYHSSDEINAINWDEVKKHQTSVDLVKGYIQIRKAHGAFRFSTDILVKKHLQFKNHHQSILEYRLENVQEYGPYSEIRVFFNTKNQSFSIPMIEKGFYLIANEFSSGTKNIKEVSDEVLLAPISTTIIVKE